MIMRKYIKNQIMEIIQSLFQANQTLRKLIVKNRSDKIYALLQDMQTAAIEVGEIIEENQGEGTEIVHLLEMLCELIWETAQVKMDEKKRLSKEINQKLQIIQGQIKTLPEKSEVVFLPYKASMWDSLESVWKAADADENTDVYVIPIPYFDKNPDGTFREEYYEGDQYPHYVPVTKYDEYDFEARRPDVIYIHNGYDDCNIVTSVHPYFYSGNLKKFTDCLVYIPYFVLAEPEPGNKDMIEHIGHFCTIPAVFHADRVIVQSEAMKKVYIEELVNATNDYSDAAKKYWDNKIEGTGSPKFDKVMNTKREDVEIPEEWMHIIDKPDGAPKKIIFYNNSISALLQYNEKMITKMKWIFEIFKENSDEIALLWRPHPLIESTLKSMRPQLWGQYKAVRDRYLAEGWGIYDDTADIDRAIVVSDAYYGDPSSVVRMYQLTGKPIMLQNVEIVY